jgi:CheY-like chemotaxis protein
MPAVIHSTLFAERKQNSSPDISSRRLRTMVVDDSETFLKIVSCVLDLDDTIDLVAAASNGVEAIDTVMRLKPELILMDVHMPGLDGLATARLLSRMSPAPVVILMSSDDAPNLRAACRFAGAFDFVHKENFRAEFEAALRRLLETEVSC